MRRKIISAITCLIFLTSMLIVAFNAAPVSGHSGDVLSAWASVIPTFDGTMSLGEWDDADTVSFTIGIPYGDPNEHLDFTLYVKNDDVNLYLALLVINEEFNDDDIARFHFDNDHDGEREIGDDAISCFAGPTGTCRDDYLASVMTHIENADTIASGTDDVVGAISHTAGDYTFEVSHTLDTADDLHDFSLSAGDTVGLNLEFFDHDAGGMGKWPASTWPMPSEWLDIVIASGGVTVDIDVDPDTLNLVSNGRWITAYIELPSGHDVADIDVASIELSCDTYAAWVDPDAPTEVGDYDGDGIPDLMVKFDRLALVEHLQTNDFDDVEGKFCDLPITITGMVAGTPFEGTDTIRVRI